MNKKTVKDICVKGKKVVMRVDFNVPLNDKQEITDDTRIRAALPTIQYVIEQGAALVLMSHLGRPKGKGYEKEFSLKPVADYLAAKLGRPVQFAEDCMAADAQVAALKSFTVVTDAALDAGFSVKLDGGRVEHAFTADVIAGELAKRLRPDLAALLK